MRPTHDHQQQPAAVTPLGTIAIVAAYLRAYAAGRQPVPALIAEVLANHLDSASLEIGRALLGTTHKRKRV